tara:strand:- start:616 stop:930 length:315 start_codon:yes stop_codon:yes gene_type:complete
MANFHNVALASEIQPGNAKCVELEGRTIAIFNVDGEFFAIDDTCPHSGGPLSEGLIEGDEVECPWHGACFSIKTGGVLSPPAVEDVQCYKTRVQDGEVQVALAE